MKHTKSTRKQLEEEAFVEEYLHFSKTQAFPQRHTSVVERVLQQR